MTATKQTTADQTSYVATIRNAETTVILGMVGVSVYVKNAAARAWGNYGKHFSTIQEAQAAYKSKEMKSFLGEIKRDQEPSNVIQFA